MKRWPSKKEKKKNLITWEDLDETNSDSSDEEAANICLMADDSEKVNDHLTDYSSSNTSSSSSFSSSSSSSSSSSYSESENENDMSYDTLLANSQFIAQAYKSCKQKLKRRYDWNF